MSSMSESISNAGKLVRQAIGAALSNVHAGEAKITSNQSGQSSTTVLDVSSSSFLHASPIPKKFTPQGGKSFAGFGLDGRSRKYQGNCINC